MAGHQVRADFATLDQLAADQGTHAGSIENYRATLRQHAMQALATLDGGMGTEEHHACMRKVDELIDEHIRATQSFQRTTGTVHDTFRQGGATARGILGQGA
ncbi:MAG TPA: hypothetical protein VFB84_16455 [Micromonosporaceae bacterium]|nr:hypothetical protein [Micromonosporaceae bacterium]